MSSRLSYSMMMNVICMELHVADSVLYFGCLYFFGLCRQMDWTRVEGGKYMR